MWFIGVEVEQETSAPLLKKILDPRLLITKTTILLVLHAFLYISLPSLHVGEIPAGAIKAACVTRVLYLASRHYARPKYEAF